MKTQCPGLFVARCGSLGTPGIKISNVLMLEPWLLYLFYHNATKLEQMTPFYNGTIQEINNIYNKILNTLIY